MSFVLRYSRTLPSMVRTLLLCATVSLAGCEGVGIPATDDPYTKLSQAEYLRAETGRIMRARQATEQAIALFDQRGDKAGLARAYRELGLIALDGGLGDDPVIIRDPGATRHPRPTDLDIAEVNLKRAFDLAVETDQLYGAANIKFVLGNVAVMRGTNDAACHLYDESIERFKDAMVRQPGAKLNLPPGVTDPTYLVRRAEKEAKCAQAQ